MDEQFTLKKTIIELVAEVRQYLETRYQWLQLDLTEKLVMVAAYLVVTLIVLLLGISFLLFISLGFGYFLGEIFKSNSLGFFTVAGIYLMAVILIVVFRKKWIAQPIINVILKSIFKPKKEKK